MELRSVLAVVRAIAPPVEEDRPLGREIEAVAAAIREGRFDEWAIPQITPDAAVVIQ
jgi:histidine ammonia-lyase